MTEFRWEKIKRKSKSWGKGREFRRIVLRWRGRRRVEAEGGICGGVIGCRGRSR